MTRPRISLRLSLLIGCGLVCLADGMAQVTPPVHVRNPPYSVQVRHFSVEQGLPNRSIVDIGQDAQGFIWIGTLNNAYRFDGNRFMPLPTPLHRSQSQLTAYIDRINRDSEGDLWFFKIRSGMDQWLDRWDARKQKLVSYTVHTGSSADLYYAGTTIGQRGQAATPVGPLVFYQRNGQIYTYTDKKKLVLVYKSQTPTHLNGIALTAGGSLLLPLSDTTETHFSLVEIDSAGKIRRQQVMPKLFRPVCTDANGAVYLVQAVHRLDKSAMLPRLTSNRLANYLYRLDPNGQLTSLPIEFMHSPFPEPRNQESEPYSLVHDRVEYDAYHDLFWFLGRHVLFAWHPDRGIVFDINTSVLPATQSSIYSSLHVDRAGGVWVGSDDGFLILTLTPNRFAQYLNRLPNNSDYSNVATRGLAQMGGALWVNAADCWLVDLTTGSRRLALPERLTQQADLIEQTPAVLAANNSLWTANINLSLVHPSTQSLEQYPLNGPANRCKTIAPDRWQNLWLGYEQGISYFDVVQKRNIPFTRYNKWPELAANRVNGFFADPQAGGMWVASSSGLYLLDSLRGIMARYSEEQPAPRHLPFNHITYVHIDPDQPGRYWLATRGGGLLRWDRATGHYRQYTQDDGLLNATLYCLYTDHPDPKQRRDKNRLWFTTDYGLVSFDKKTGRSQTYLPKDGTTHEEFNLMSNYQAPDGRLFLGGLNGVTAFWPNQIQESAATKAPMVVTQVQQLNGETGTMTSHLANYQPGQPVQIASSSRAFLLSFALLDYRFLGQTRLWYRIQGWQEAWATQNHTDLRINGLPSGHYQLEVRMQNINGQWVSDILTIPVVVEPPVYARLWFVLLCLLAVAGLLVTVFRWRSRRLVRETVRLEAEVANRTAQIKADKAIIEQQAAELREHTTRQSRFFANVTHEFRTPLTLLLGPLTYLTKRNSDATTHRLLTTMERSARQLQELVTDLLGLGKLEVGQVQLAPQPADLRAVVARTVAAFSTQASLAGITLSSRGLDQPIGMLLDVPKLETVVRNLIANALRFTPSGGIITIQITDGTNQVRVSVADTGRGIHPDDLPHLVERYYQSNRPDAPLQGGTGIGLALCHEYCQLWQGELTIDSTLGQGSTFTFTYPKRAAELPASSADLPLTTQLPASVLGAAVTMETGRETILIVEDNPDMAGYIQLLLAPHYAYHWCRNGLDALAWLAGQTTDTLPNLILTDMMMPEMDGMALLEALRQQTALRTIPVIMLTARFSHQVRLQALQLGVADYLTKPFDEDELLTRLQNLLDRARERAFWLMPPDGPSANKNQTSATENGLEAGEAGVDPAWLQHIHTLVVDNLTDSRFQVNDLAEGVNMSQRHFYRRLKTLTGLSPIQFVQEVRLQTAYEWIEEGRYKTVKEVAHRVGFQKVSYFSRLYHQRFGVYPKMQLIDQQEDKPTASARTNVE